MKTGLLEYLVVLMILKVVSFDHCCMHYLCISYDPRILYAVLIFNLLFENSNIILGMTGIFCPCMLFGRNVEALNDEIPSNNACICHMLCVEGGMALAAITAFIPGIDPSTSCLITEGLLFTWWMCGIYTGMARQSLQRKYHLKVCHIYVYFHHIYNNIYESIN